MPTGAIRHSLVSGAKEVGKEATKEVTKKTERMVSQAWFYVVFLQSRHHPGFIGRILS